MLIPGKPRDYRPGVAYEAEGTQSGGALSIDGAAELFAKLGMTEPDKDADKQPSAPGKDQDQKAPAQSGVDNDAPKEGQETDDPQEQQDAAEETEATEQETEDADDDAAKAPVSDDAVVKITVDGQEHEVAVRDLKRLWGQEKALTRKSQEIAEKRKALEEAHKKTAVVLDRQLQRAREKWAEFEKIDFIAISHKMEPDAFAELRKAAIEAWQDLQFAQKEADEFLAQLKERQAQALREAAQEAVRQLSDPEKGIPGWSDDLYNELRRYAVSEGIAQEMVDAIVDPAAIRIVWKAMQYDKAKQAAAVKVKPKVSAAPKKVIKPSVSQPAADDTASKRRDLLAKLRASGGKVDAAAALFDLLDG